MDTFGNPTGLHEVKKVCEHYSICWREDAWSAPLKSLHFDVESAQQKDGQMKKRFTEEQIIGILKGQEPGERTADVCRRHGVSQATFYK